MAEAAQGREYFEKSKKAWICSLQNSEGGCLEPRLIWNPRITRATSAPLNPCFSGKGSLQERTRCFKHPEEGGGLPQRALLAQWSKKPGSEVWLQVTHKVTHSYKQGWSQRRHITYLCNRAVWPLPCIPNLLISLTSIFPSTVYRYLYTRSQQPFWSSAPK